MSDTYMLNFAHPFTVQQIDRLRDLLSCEALFVCNIPTHFDLSVSFVDQLPALFEQIPMTSMQWQQERIAINPPTLSVIATLVLAELHGRMGYFPPIVRLRPRTDSLPPVFEVAEVMNLQHVRDGARRLR